MESELTAQLEALYHRRHHVSEQDRRERGDAASSDQDALAAAEWANCMHRAFYAASGASRGSNLFLEMEETLQAVFARLCRVAKPEFWGFAVHVVLLVSQEPRKPDQVSSDGGEQADALSSDRKDDGNATANKDKKKKKKEKLSQPFAPLAFMLVGALKNLIGDGDPLDQRRYAEHEGHTNAALRDFCLCGLRDARKTNQKLLVEILDLFGMRDIDVSLVRQAAESLKAAKSYTALIKLFAVFPQVKWSLEESIRDMTGTKDWSSAELLVKVFDDETQKPLARFLVDAAIDAQEFKRAHRIVYKFGLQDAYPDIESLYCRDGLMKLIEKQRWEIAISFAGSDESLQRMVLNYMVAAGEVIRAVQLAKSLQLDDFDSDIDEAQLHRPQPASFVNGLNGYLPFELDIDADVQFCSNEDSIRRAYEYFFDEEEKAQTTTGRHKCDNEFVFDRRHIVGLDVEWKPTSTKIAAATGSITTTAVASILQVASPARVFIIDLLALQDCAYLFEVFLSNLFSSPRHLKVGFGFDTDIKVLHQTFPERSACLSVSPFLELSTVLSKFFSASVGNSLSNAANTILGKPLDKGMQLSNWDERPLSRAQLTYAALDAFCLVRMVEELAGCTTEGKSDKDFPAWTEVVAEIGDLVLASPLQGDEIAAAIQLRNEYHRNWTEHKHMQTADAASPTLGPDDIQSYWDECLRGQQISEDIDTRLQFLPVGEARNFLSQTSDGRDHGSVLAVNTICFFADERPGVAFIDASCKLDTSQLAQLCGMSRRKIKLATGLECTEQFGFAPGTIPPFGHRNIRRSPPSDVTIPVYADSSLRSASYLLCGGGSTDTLLRLHADALFAVIDIKAVGDIQRGVSATSKLVATASGDDGTSDETSATAEREYKFLADSMVARVGKWMRTLGIDVVIWDPYALPKKTGNNDHKTALLALAVAEQRILLTRDKKLANRRDAGACYVVSSDNPYEQFQEIRAHFALQLVEEDLMSRCARCNAKGFDIVDVDYVRNQTEDEVHPNVLEIVTEFWVCRVCHKVFWEGPKFSSSYENVLRMFSEHGIDRV